MLVFAVKCLPLLLAGFIISSALLPLVPVWVANLSIFEGVAMVFQILKWDTALLSQVFAVFGIVGIYGTIGGLVELAIVILFLAPFSRPGRKWKSPVNSFTLVMACLLLVPFLRSLEYSGNVPYALLNKSGAMEWTDGVIRSASERLGIDLSQDLHRLVGGSANISVWERANKLYRAMKFDPQSLGRMEAGEEEIKLIFSGAPIKDSDDPMGEYIRGQAMVLLGRVPGEYSHAILLNALNDPSGFVRVRAIQALSGQCGLDDVKPVMQAVSTLPDDLRKEAYPALLDINVPEARDIFRTGLGSKDPLMRTVSALWLGKYDPDSGERLVNALSGDGSEFRENIFWSGELMELTPMEAKTVALLQLQDITVMPGLSSIAQYGSIDSRMAAMTVLGSTRDIQAQTTLVNLLSSKTPAIRAFAASQLKNFNDTGVQEALYSALDDPAESVRMRAAFSLYSLGATPEITTQTLLSAIQNEDLAMASRIDAAGALGFRADKTAVPQLIGFLDNDSLDADLSSAVISALTAIGGDEAIPASLTGFLQNKMDTLTPEFIRPAALAVSGIRQIKGEAGEKIIVDMAMKSGNIFFRQGALTGLQDFSGGDARTFMMRNLFHEDPSIRFTAVNILGSRVVDDIGVRDGFVRALEVEPFPVIRSRIVSGLGTTYDDGMTGVLRTALDDPAWEVKRMAIIALIPYADDLTNSRVSSFLTSSDLTTRQSAVLYLGAHADAFPANMGLIRPLLTSGQLQMKQAAINALSPHIADFPELTQDFLDISRDKTQPVVIRQQTMASLAQIRTPEIKNLFVNNLSSPAWQIRQVSALSLGTFQDDDIVSRLAPLVKDPSWQVRQASAISLGKFTQPQSFTLLKPLLNDRYWQVRLSTVNALGAFDSLEAINVMTPSLSDDSMYVRQASILPLASNLKFFPELKQPLLTRLQDRNEDAWIRSVAAAGLQSAGYSVEPYLNGIKPLEKSLVVFVHGVGKDLGFDFNAVMNDPGWSLRDPLGQDFSRLETIGGSVSREHSWSGGLDESRLKTTAPAEFEKDAWNYLDEAKNLGFTNITFLLHSEANVVAVQGIEAIAKEAAAEKIKINIISFGSPSVISNKAFRSLENNYRGHVRFEHFEDSLDPIAWMGLPFLDPQTRYVSVWPVHTGYRSDINVRQTALTVATGVQIPISLTRSTFGSFSDAYSLTAFRAQQSIINYNSGAQRIETNMWIHTETRFQDFTIPPAPVIPNYNPNPMPRFPSGPLQ